MYGISYRDLEKMDDLGWKSKLKIPPKDRRIKTSVNIQIHVIFFLDYDDILDSPSFKYK